MSEFDLHSNIDDRVALVNQSITSNTTTVGIIIDTKGFESLEFLIQAGALNDGDFTVILEEGDDAGLSDAAVVPVANVLGSLPIFDAITDDDTVARVGSIGKKRFQRMSISSLSTVGANFFSGVAILGTPHTAPVAQ